MTQLALMLFFYGMWIFIPRIIWHFSTRIIKDGETNWHDVIVKLSVLGIFLSGFHVLVLSIIWRIMFFPADNPNRSVVHWIHTFGEVWLGNAGIWIMAYGGATAIILYAIISPEHKEQKKSRYEVRQNGKIWSISYFDIFWIKAAGNYAEIHSTHGILMVRKTLSKVTKELASNQFLVPHRSALVNGNHVVAIKPRDDGSGFLIQLSNGDEAPLSRRKLSEFRDALKLVD